MCCSEKHGGAPQENLYLVEEKSVQTAMEKGWGDDAGGCICTGSEPQGYCCGVATGPDGLCDRCRRVCHRFDAESALKFHHVIPKSAGNEAKDG